MNLRYALVAPRAAHRCESCHTPESVFNFPFEVEHIIPLSLGGADVESNWALAGRSCNLRKGASVTAPDPETQANVQLFHPRQDSWDEHFRVERESGSILGLDAVGRATISRLDMNSPTQITARRQWVRLGAFP